MNIENDVLETFIRSVKLIDEFDMEFDIKTLVSYKQQILTYLTTYKIKKKIAHILERLYDNVNNKIEEIFDEIHRSNMSKIEDGVVLRRADGKVQKGKNYFKPNIEQILNK